MKTNSQSFSLPYRVSSRVEAALRDWLTGDRARRIWQRDASVWTDRGEEHWLGWLDIVRSQLQDKDRFRKIAAEVREAGFRHALLLGMGGSSLCPDVMRASFGPIPEYPSLRVLDSTDPGQIRAAENGIDLGRTLVIVSSKSGTTLETRLLMDYFLDRVRTTVGSDKAPDQLVAITDPGSELEATARRSGFRRVFLGRPDIGGRFSALSDFGLVPAAVMGVDVGSLLERTMDMVEACGGDRPALANPGLELGVVLGTLAKGGVDKVTLVASPPVSSLGGWLEQLLAESTGKEGRGLIPVEGEPLGPPEVYGQDRVFVYLRTADAIEPDQELRIAALEEAGQPVVRIELRDAGDLGQEFFRWEFATAVAGAELGVNPFDQPDVEASKRATKTITAHYEATGALPDGSPVLETDRFRVFAGARDTEAPWNDPDARTDLAALLGAHLGQLQPGDYFSILAFIEMNDAAAELLEEIRRAVRDGTRTATSAGFGPRYLHSTGQLHKGGPATGAFLEITSDGAADLPAPEREYTFGLVETAQAIGDFNVLVERNRRILRVHIRGDTLAGLRSLRDAVARALGAS